mmetsp:Transcript_18260/g.59751  ORF Transcript_18260/g.59751 Transcript_18260/m.59751 type:complete len:203 (-) Transcript_18260:1484-2092(-)
MTPLKPRSRSCCAISSPRMTTSSMSSHRFWSMTATSAGAKFTGCIWRSRHPITTSMKPIISSRVAPIEPDLSMSAPTKSLNKCMCILRSIGVSSNPIQTNGCRVALVDAGALERRRPSRMADGPGFWLSLSLLEPLSCISDVGSAVGSCLDARCFGTHDGRSQASTDGVDTGAGGHSLTGSSQCIWVWSPLASVLVESQTRP